MLVRPNAVLRQPVRRAVGLPRRWYLGVPRDDRMHGPPQHTLPLFTRYAAARRAYWCSQNVGTKQASGFVKIIAPTGSLAPPKVVILMQELIPTGNLPSKIHPLRLTVAIMPV